MAEVTVKKDRELIYFVIYCIIAALGWIIPPVEPITAAGMHLLSVFFATIFGWSISQEVWPSMVALILIPFTGMTNLAGMIGIAFGTDMVLFMLLLFIMVAFLEQTGSTAYVAAFLMTRKFLKGHPWRLIFMLFAVALVLSTFCGNFAGMLITWSFIYKISGVLGYRPYEKFPNLLVFGVAVMGALSLSMVPWANNALVILNAYMASTGDTINYVHYLAFSIPVDVFCILGYMALCKFVFRMDVSRLKAFDANVFDAKDLEFTSARKLALGSLVLLIIMILVPSVLPADSLIGTISANMGLSMKAMLVFLVLSLIRVDGNKIFEFHKLAAKGIPWNMVVMVMAILCFVSLLGSADAGISAFLGATLTPLFTDASVIILFLLVLIITLILTNFMINMVVVVIMIAASLPIATALGVSGLQIVYLITLSCTIAFMLPAASAASCVLFANTEWIKAKDIYKYAFPTIIMMALVTLAWNLIFFMF